MLIGHDSETGHTFSWDNGEIVYLGKQYQSMKQAPCDGVLASIIAAAATSGFSCPVVKVCAGGALTNILNWWSALPRKDPLRHYAFIDEPDLGVLDENPSAAIHVMRYGDAAIALGYLLVQMYAAEVKPGSRRWWFLEPDREHAEGRVLEYEELDGDAAGKMARFCGDGYAVLNERYSTVWDSCFHGRVLVGKKPPDVDGVHLVPLVAAQTYFPGLSLATRYAACCCPIEVPNTKAFSGNAEDFSERVKVRFVGPADDNDMGDFIRFWNILTKGRVSVASLEKKVLPRYNRTVTFKYDRAYVKDFA